jgi:UDPglucose 6-dehydrogenase
MDICMVGAGYVGLVSAACFAEFGWTVECIEKEPQRLSALRLGEVPIYEAGLEDLVRRQVVAKRLRFSTDLAGAVD